MVLKEAMASGTAVISVDCPHGPGDILQKGIYGMLIPPDNPKALADAMLTLANDDRLHKDLVQKGLSRADRYDIGNIIHQWQDLFLQAG
jgi:glycosyltransferase involved in cell wall biosynthesis